MKTKKSQRPVIWAVDPFSKEKRLQTKTGAILKKLYSEQAAEIEPVYVLDHRDFEVPFDVSRGLALQIQTSASEELSRLVKKGGFPPLKPLKILQHSGESSGECAEILLDYARSVSAELIVLSTRNTRGPKRWVLGSFAESLSLVSDVPLLIVNPEVKKADFQNILFPSDFSRESKKAFDQALEFAKAHGSQITLFHKVTFEWFMAVAPAYEGYPNYTNVFKEVIEGNLDEAKVWAEKGRALGVPVKTVFDYTKSTSPAEAILRRAKRENATIALAGVSGSFKTALIGSTTRKIIRNAPTPVWVIHPLTSAPRSRKKAKRATATVKRDKKSLPEIRPS